MEKIIPIIIFILTVIALGVCFSRLSHWKKVSTHYQDKFINCLSSRPKHIKIPFYFKNNSGLTDSVLLLHFYILKDETYIGCQKDDIYDCTSLFKPTASNTYSTITSLSSKTLKEAIGSESIVKTVPFIRDDSFFNVFLSLDGFSGTITMSSTGNDLILPDTKKAGLLNFYSRIN